MGLHVYNYLNRRVEEFTPVTPGRVGMYVCGPTVYDHAHLGHAKLYVSFDVINRYLRFLGNKVRYVQNITDVGHLLDSGEDRISVGAAREELEPMEVVEKYTKSYFDDMDALGVLRPDISPRASGHIPDQIQMVKRLIERGHAYEVGGSVYFSVRSYPSYGHLARRKLEDLAAGARVDTREEKRDPLDFALWKRAEPDHIMKWESPWSVGYPGWHAECSAMSAKYLGLPYDIHGGGLDNIFPHNESEIAQADCAFGRGYANYWLFAGQLSTEGVKMSKSLGNSVRLRDTLKQYDPATIRMFILTGSYRSPLAFSDEALKTAHAGSRRLLLATEKLSSFLESRHLKNKDDIDNLSGECVELKDRFIEAMNDDFNTPVALSVLFDAAKMANTILSEPTPQEEPLRDFDLLFRRLGADILGIAASSVGSSDDLSPKLIDILLDVRRALRAEKNFELADQIRARLSEAGIVVEDSKAESSWRFE
jgi:cysteinyl-tRNA synthetase